MWNNSYEFGTAYDFTIYFCTYMKCGYKMLLRNRYMPCVLSDVVCYETGKATRARTEEPEGKVSDYLNKILISMYDLITEIPWAICFKIRQNSGIAISKTEVESTASQSFFKKTYIHSIISYVFLCNIWQLATYREHLSVLLWVCLRFIVTFFTLSFLCL